MRFVISGGGTGGHITPGLAVAAALHRRPGTELLWIGTAGRREADLVPRAGIPFQAIPGKSFKRGMSPRALVWNLLAVLAVSLGMLKSLRLLRRFRPHAVIGTGGYVCFPIVMAAKLLGLPAIICEQNSLPGLTVRVLSRFVDAVAVSYSSTRDLLPAARRIAHTGNPVAAELSTLRQDQARIDLELPADRLVVLVLGGSLGSVALNRVVSSAVATDRWRKDLARRWFIVHGTGQSKYAAVQAATGDAPSYQAMPYIYENFKALAAADAVISRAGATTIAEITTRGLPALLVPWPGAAHDHQTHNARLLDHEGAARCVSEDAFTPDSLLDFLAEMTDSRQRARMAGKARAMSIPDAVERIISLIDEVRARRGQKEDAHHEQ
ncbi:undecaprenyldiphospho-muramoylpentapeptide beta-N-acetylglucosaminyltransferase [bacterium]|nr:undecaprenyldiphospho-muramoylpentapeptide beta-N-acetylglucosaminyltransferase [candidate division CSSED10-310 bacterium]